MNGIKVFSFQFSEKKAKTRSSVARGPFWKNAVVRIVLYIALFVLCCREYFVLPLENANVYLEHDFFKYFISMLSF